MSVAGSAACSHTVVWRGVFMADSSQESNLSGSAAYGRKPEQRDVPQPLRRQLQDEIDMLRRVLDYIPDYVFVKDTESRFLYNNKAHLQVLGATCQEDVLGKTDFDIFPQELAVQYYADEQYVLRTGNALADREELTKLTDGKTQILSTTKAILRGKNREIIGLFGISRDITLRIKTEEEKKELESQLQQSQKLESLGQLAGGIAHDFNNMLGAISGYAGMIVRKLAGRDSALADYANTIIEASERAADLTRKLLDFARKGKYTLKVVDMNDTVRDAIKLLEHTIDRKIELVQQLNANPAIVMGDPSQLQNSIINLAINARDAMKNGGKMTFSTEIAKVGTESSHSRLRGLAPGDYLKFSLTDTGIGMDAETISRIFEPFFTTKEKGQGTGLGLASVYGIIKNHNGQILVSSKPGEGAEFDVYLPLADKPAEAEFSAGEVLKKGKGTILVVDDEEMIRRMARDMLKEMGYNVYCSKDGREATEFYRAHYAEIDAVILDMIMPRMSGADCAKEIKNINPDAKIILATGYSSPHDTQKIIARGISGFLQKPFEEAELSEVVHEVLISKPGLNR
jgi:PAS domain S-box-containing protein